MNDNFRRYPAAAPMNDNFRRYPAAAPMNDNFRRYPAAAPVNDQLPPAPVLPHHKLVAFDVAKALLSAVLSCRIRDAKVREHALKSAKSACLNVAEGAGRVTKADKARAFAVARGECVEAAAAVKIAALCGDAPAAAAGEVALAADRLVALLTGLCRP